MQTVAAADTSTTWVKGPLGFEVFDAFSFDAGPKSNRELVGVWLTGFPNACDKNNATPGAGVLRIDFSEEHGNIPALGTYPLQGPSPEDLKTTFAQVWWVTAAGCDQPGVPGGSFESGTVTIEKSDKTGMVGSFQGMLVIPGDDPVHIEGHFNAPRCPSGGTACTP
jgi:hypothetical protein